MSDEEQRAIGAADPDGSESRVVAGPGRAAREPEQIDDLFRRLASSVRGVIHADRVVVDLVDPITGDLRREYASEMDEGSPRSASDPGGCSAIEEEVRATGTPAKLDDGEDTADPLPSSAEPDKSEFRSGIYAPVRVDGAVIGVLGAEVNEPRAYTTSNLDLLEQIANLAAVSVANAQSQGWSERETAEDILIAEIGRKARSTLDLDDAVDHIFEGLKDIFPVERVSISLNSGSTGVPDVVYAAGAPMAFAPGFSTGIPSTDGLISLVALSGGSKLVEDVTEVLDDAPGARRVTEAGFKSIILVPLSSDEEVIGVLALFSKRAHAHTAHDLDLVERLAIHLTEPIVNAQIHASTERRAQNEALLAEIGRVATSVPDIDSVLEKITDLLSTVTTFDCMSLSTVDPDRQSMTVRFIFGDTMPGYEEGIERPVNGSYAEDILKDQSAVVMTGEELDSLDTWFPDLGDFIRRNGFQSCMIVPIFHIETPAGLLTVHSRAPDSYSQGEKDLAERISDQISGAFANAAMRSELTSRAREEAVFAEIGRVLNTTDSFETAFDLVSTQIARVVPFDRFSAAEINPERRTFTALRHSGSDVGEWKSGPARKLEGTVAELVFESGETQVIGQADPTEIIERYPAMIAFVEAGFRSSLNVPIRIDARTAGILYFASRTPVQYSEHHANLARRCADQIAGVLAKADLTERIERQARVEARLAEVGRAVGDTLELDDLWPNFVGPVRELFDYNRLAVTLYEDDSIERTTAFVDGMSIAGSVPGDFHPYDEPAAALMRAHTSFIASDAASDARDADLLGPECVVAGFRSMIASPVIFNRNLVGSICLKSIRIEGYSERDRELLDRVAELIAGAVANARLHREVMIRAEEERVFSDIGRLVSASLDFGGAFDELAELVKRLIPYDRFVIMGVDVDAQLLWTHYVSGTDVPGWGPGSSRSFSGWGPGRLPAPSEGVISDTDAGADPGDDSAMWAGLPALMSLPLVWEGRTIGNLSVRSTEAGRFNQHHLDLLRRVGQQIVGAFVNAELHAVTVREAGERSALAEIGRLVTSSLDGHEMLAAIAEPFKKLIPFDRLAVTVLERDSREWAPRYAIGTPIPGFEPGDRTRRLSPTSSWSSITPSPVIVNRGDADVGPYGFVMQPANRVGLLSALFVPMTVNGEIIGVLSVRSSRPNAYGQKHLELSRRIGAQIAGAVANAELHRALADNESRTRAVVETAAVGIVTADSQLIMQSVNDAILEMFGYRREELIGQNVMILANPAFRDTHRMYVKEYLENGMHHMFGQVREVNGTRKSGLAFPMELEVTEINLAQGRTYTAIIRDVTDRRLAEDEISELNAELERRVIERTAELQEANAELEAFSYMVSHDLRGPLGMSASLASRLLDSKEPALPEHARKYVELIAQSSAASADLVADLLNFARVGHQSLMVQQVDLEEIAVSVQAEFADRFPDVKWTLNPLPLCEADPGLLRAVFTNLLSNAYKFTASEPEPSIEVGSTSVDGGLVYYVRDNGVGFDMDGIDKVFKVFERLHRPEDYSGTGAGLAIVQRIIERHGGQIWAESKVGAGATFFFTLPQANGSPSAGMHDQDT